MTTGRDPEAASMTQIDIREIGDQLVAARPALDAAQQRIAITLYRLLAEGEPVAAHQLAEHAGAPVGAVDEFLAAHPGVYLDDETRVIGFWGLALSGMPHRLTVAGRELRAWCAWDTLFLPELLGEAASVTSTCPTTGETVGLDVTPEGVRSVSPAGAVLSFLRREETFDADTIETFCHFVHFFVDEAAVREWTARHPGTFVLSLEEGAELAHQVNRATLGAALAAGTGGADGRRNCC
jgi:alkylmercury lyase